MINFFAFGGLGTFIGLLVGLSGSTAIEAIVAGLFTIAGATAITYITKFDTKQQKEVGKILSMLIFGALVGLFSGIIIDQHELLGSKTRYQNLEDIITEIISIEIETKKKNGKKVTISELTSLINTMSKNQHNPYLNNANIDQISAIFQKQAVGHIDEVTAFRELKEILKK